MTSADPADSLPLGYFLGWIAAGFFSIAILGGLCIALYRISLPQNEPTATPVIQEHKP